MKAVYKLDFDCQRQGSLEGVFVSTKEKVKTLIKSKIKVYFGEVLGKHSEIGGPIEKGEIIMLSDDPAVVNTVEKYNLASGYNPFNYTTYDFNYEGIDNDGDHTVEELCEMILDLKRKKILR